MNAVTTIKIEKGIPIPPRQWRTSKWINQFQSMEVGDSFLVATEEERMAAIAHPKRLKQYGITLVSRKINGEGYRIWRVK